MMTAKDRASVPTCHASAWCNLETNTAVPRVEKPVPKRSRLLANATMELVRLQCEERGS